MFEKGNNSVNFFYTFKYVCLQFQMYYMHENVLQNFVVEKQMIFSPTKSG